MSLDGKKILARIAGLFKKLNGAEYKPENDVVANKVDHKKKVLYLIEKLGGPDVEAQIELRLISKKSAFAELASSDEYGGNILGKDCGVDMVTVSEEALEAFKNLTKDEKGIANGKFMQSFMGQMEVNGEEHRL